MKRIVSGIYALFCKYIYIYNNNKNNNVDYKYTKYKSYHMYSICLKDYIDYQTIINTFYVIDMK